MRSSPAGWTAARFSRAGDYLETTSANRGDEFLMMKDTSVTKVTSEFSPHGPEGQKYLASGVHVAMRLWENEKPNEKKPVSKHPYETVGYVLKGKAELNNRIGL